MPVKHFASQYDVLKKKPKKRKNKKNPLKMFQNNKNLLLDSELYQDISV